MDIETLKAWQKGLRASRDKISQKQEEGGASFKDKLVWAKAKVTDNDTTEDALKEFSLLDAYAAKARQRARKSYFQKRQEKNKKLAKEAEAIATQRIRQIKAENFLRARYEK